jgi:hypothetical protein
MDKKNLMYALVLLAVLVSVRVAQGQLPANLSAPTPIAGSSGPTNMSANLSAENGPGSLGAGGSGRRSRASVAGGPSSPGAGSASAFGSQGSFLTLHAAALSSRASLSNGHEKIQQETGPTSVRASTKTGSRSAGGTSLFVPRMGPSVLTTSTRSSARSFSSRSSGPEVPLYSLLVHHDRGGSRSADSQGFSSKFGHGKNSSSGLIQSLTGAGSGLGSSR